MTHVGNLKLKVTVVRVEMSRGIQTAAKLHANVNPAILLLLTCLKLCKVLERQLVLLLAKLCARLVLWIRRGSVCPESSLRHLRFKGPVPCSSRSKYVFVVILDLIFRFIRFFSRLLSDSKPIVISW
jgi:hypothetical protein